MPLLRIETNVTADEDQCQTLITEASQTVARELGKPEQYVMVALEPNARMLFAGGPAPLAYLELRSIGLAENQTAPLSAALCDLMERTLGIRKDRVFINFASVPPAMWGWNGGTF